MKPCLAQMFYCVLDLMLMIQTTSIKICCHKWNEYLTLGHLSSDAVHVQEFTASSYRHVELLPMSQDLFLHPDSPTAGSPASAFGAALAIFCLKKYCYALVQLLQNHKSAS